MMAYATTQQCRMSALIRHFGDISDAHKPCGRCDFCSPSGTSAQTFGEPSAAQDRDLRAILRALAECGGTKATGRLFTDLAICKERNEFEGLLDGLARAGLISIAAETFTNAEGKTIPYKKASLTHEGREVGPGEKLGVLLRGAVEAATGLKAKAKPVKVAEPAVPLSASQKALEEQLRAWRKAEAAKTGKPAFLVCSDAALLAVVVACPRTIQELLTVSGFGKDKAERYGAEICGICRGGGSGAHPSSPVRTGKAPPAEGGWRLVPSRTPPPAGVAKPPQEFKRERPVVLKDGAAELDGAQKSLEERLRAWRKAESEKMGLPQFFVLGTTTLRSLVIERPKTLKELMSIQGIGQEKVDRYGAGILAVLNG
jgi:ATP-dependent DNA helicase RecQ